MINKKVGFEIPHQTCCFCCIILAFFFLLTQWVISFSLPIGGYLTQDQMNIETKIRNIRFIGELCKFKIAPAGLVFSCLKVLFSVFVLFLFNVVCDVMPNLCRDPYYSNILRQVLHFLFDTNYVKAIWVCNPEPVTPFVKCLFYII